MSTRQPFYAALLSGVTSFVAQLGVVGELANPHKPKAVAAICKVDGAKN